MKSFFRTALLTSAAALAGLGASTASAQPWQPTRNVEYIVPAGPGAALDTAARELKDLVERMKLSPTPMLVSNRPGGAGMVAMGTLANHAGDGHMLMTLTHSAINNRLVGEVKLGYDDFTPLATLFDEFITVVVRADSPIRDGRDLVERLRKDPRALSIGIATSIGNHIHVAIAKPLKVGGVDISKLIVVPFKSSSESMTNLLGGHIDVVSASAINVVSQLKAGKIRVIAVASAERLRGDLASIPTWREQGIDAVYGSSQGVLGAKGLTPAQIRYWEQTLKQVTDTPQWAAFLAKNHWTPHFMDSAQSRKYLDDEAESAKTVLGELGLLKP